MHPAKLRIVEALRSRLLSRKIPLALSLGLVLGTAVIYWQVRNFDFILLDDNEWITENPHVFMGLSWENVKWALTDLSASGFWQPMVWLTLIFDSQWYQMNPGGFHFTNFLLHSANGVLLFWILFQMTAAPFRSSIVAALFAFHPLHVESVAWIAERKDVLSTFFGLWSIQLYLFFVKTTKDPHPNAKRSLYYLLSIVFFVLALSTKAMLVTLPLCLVLLDYWPLGRYRNQFLNSNRFFNEINRKAFFRTLIEKIPFFFLSTFFSILTLVTHAHIVALNKHLSIAFRIKKALISYGVYLYKFFWPFNLSVLYATLEDPGWKGPFASLVFLAVFSFWVRRSRISAPWLLTGWLWYLITLIPVLRLVPMGSYDFADRFTYIPSIGIFILLAWGLSIPPRGPFRAVDSFFSYPLIRASLVSGIFGVLIYTAHLQTAYWKDGESLFRHSLEVSPDSYVLHNNLGNILVGKGKTEEGMSHFLATIRIKPTDSFARNNLGMLYANQGKVDEALKYYNEGLKQNPGDPLIHNNLGLLLDRNGRRAEAYPHFFEALKTSPNLTAAHNNLGIMFAADGKLQEAIVHYQAALKSDPHHSDTYNNLGAIYLQQGKIPEARSEFENSLRYNKEHPQANFNLGIILALEGRVPQAIEHFLIAVKRLPNDPNLHYNLATAYLLQGRGDLAKNEIEILNRLRPELARKLAGTASPQPKSGKQSSNPKNR